MGFNSEFNGLKLFKKPGNGRWNNLNDSVLNVLTEIYDRLSQKEQANGSRKIISGPTIVI